MDTIQTESRLENTSAEPQSLHVEDGEIDIFEILIILAKHKQLIITATLAAAVLAAILTLLLPNRYTATAKLLPPQASQSAASMILNQIAGGGAGALMSLAGTDLGLKNPNDIYVAMLESRTVEDKLISKFDLGSVYDRQKPTEIRKALEGATDISSEKSGVITIAVEDKDPKRAADMANSYIEELRTLTQTLSVTEASQRRLFFQQQLEQAKAALSDAEVSLRDTQQRTGMIDLSAQARAIIQSIGTIRGEIVAKEVQLQGMRTFATEDNPTYVLLRQELAGLRDQLAKLERSEEGGNGNPMLATAKVPTAALEYVRKLREFKYRETVFRLLAQQFEIAKLDESKEGAVIQVLDGAVIPDKKSSPLRALIVIFAAFVVFCGSIFVSLALESMERLKHDPTRAEQLSRFKKLMSVPTFRWRLFSKKQEIAGH